MANFCKNNIPGPLADSYCNNLINELDSFRQKNSLEQCQSNISIIKDGHGANTWENKIFQSTRIISTIEESKFITDFILNNSNDERKEVVISLDIRGERVGVNGTITLIGIGTTQGEAFIFDVLKCSAIIFSGGLKDVLESQKIIKIMYDCRNDSLNLVSQFEVQLMNVFDAQVARSIIFHQKERGPKSRFKPITLNRLCSSYKAPINQMREILKSVAFKDRIRFCYEERPLIREMILYIAGDILILINKQLYNGLTGKFSRPNLTAFSRKCSQKIKIVGFNIGRIIKRQEKRKNKREDKRLLKKIRKARKQEYI